MLLICFFAARFHDMPALRAIEPRQRAMRRAARYAAGGQEMAPRVIYHACALFMRVGGLSPVAFTSVYGALRGL